MPGTPPWLRVRTLEAPLPETVLRRALANGEREAIALALEARPDAIILHDLPARRVAQTAGLNVVGTLGVLLGSKRIGLQPSVQNLTVS